MRSTVAVLAVAAAAAPSLVSALPRPQSGSAAISLSTIDDGVKLVGDAANAVPAIKSAWDKVFHRELDASTVHSAGPSQYPDDHDARIGTTEVHHQHNYHHAHHEKTPTAASAQPSTSYSARADSDGSEAFSFSALGDGLKLFGDAANAAPAIESAWDNFFRRRESSDPAAQDSSEAISLGTIGDGIKLVGDVANAAPTIENIWDDIFHRELDDLMARDDSDGSEAISLSTIGDGFKLFGDAANAGSDIKSAWDQIFGRRDYPDVMAREHRMSPSERLHRLSRLQGKTHTGSAKMRKHPKSAHAATPTHASMHARSPITEGEVDDGLKIAGDAFNDIPAIKNAWDSVFHRRFLDEMD